MDEMDVPYEAIAQNFMARKRKKKKKRRKRLPDEIFYFDNPDKIGKEFWGSGRGMLNFPTDFRALLVGIPSCGKTNIIFNLIAHQRPSFEEVIVIHCDPETREYDNIENCTVMDMIPEPTSFDFDTKKLVVIDDVQCKELDKQQRKNLDRLFGFVASHKHTSVVITTQNLPSIPPMVRRCCDLFILFKNPDILGMVSKKAKKKSWPKNIF